MDAKKWVTEAKKETDLRKMKITLMMDTEAGKNNYFHYQNLRNKRMSLQEDKQTTLQ